MRRSVSLRFSFKLFLSCSGTLEQYTPTMQAEEHIMAICEVCGYDQYPANTRIWMDKTGLRHFFCSDQHLESFVAGPPEAETLEERKEQEVKEAVVLPERQKELDEAAKEGREPAPSRLLCPECGFEAQNKAGLAAHQRAKHVVKR